LSIHCIILPSHFLDLKIITSPLFISSLCVKYEGEWETIKDVEILPRINTVTFECESGKVFTALKDDDFEFKCSNKRIKKVPNCKRLKKVKKK